MNRAVNLCRQMLPCAPLTRFCDIVTFSCVLIVPSCSSLITSPPSFHPASPAFCSSPLTRSFLVSPLFYVLLLQQDTLKTFVLFVPCYLSFFRTLSFYAPQCLLFLTVLCRVSWSAVVLTPTFLAVLAVPVFHSPCLSSSTFTHIHPQCASYFCFASRLSLSHFPSASPILVPPLSWVLWSTATFLIRYPTIHSHSSLCSDTFQCNLHALRLWIVLSLRFPRCSQLVFHPILSSCVVYACMCCSLRSTCECMLTR